MTSDREIGQAYAAHGARRALDEAWDAPTPDRRVELWRSRLQGSVRPSFYAGLLYAGWRAREAILRQFKRIDRAKAEEQQRIEAAMRAEFDPVAVAASMRQHEVLPFRSKTRASK